jgi:hypothetical protein
VHDVGKGHFPNDGVPGPLVGLFGHLLLHKERRHGDAKGVDTN